MNFNVERTMPNILCCICGSVTQVNASNMCINCLRTQVDITEGITKQVLIQFCKSCERYLQPPTMWVKADLESRQLLALCLKRIKGLNKVRLIDAGFIWTEPHSKRIKVRINIQKEVFTSTILQQQFIVEFTVNHTMCPDCHQTEAKLTWKAVCQVRQKVDHKRTFYWLEQLILKHDAHRNCLNIKEMGDGIDFFFANKSVALKFKDFVGSVVPIRSKTSKELISHDIHEDTYNYKFSISIEIAPICKDDLVYLGKGYGFFICSKLSTSLHFIHPTSLQSIELQSTNYWKTANIRSVASRDRLTKFIVLDINPVHKNYNQNHQNQLNASTGSNNSNTQHHHSRKTLLAEAVIARESDFGKNNQTFTVLTHLGAILHPGDQALGYDITTMNFDDDFDFRGLQEIVLIRKEYAGTRKKRRKWRLDYLPKEEETSFKKQSQDKSAREHEEFLQDLEEDPELWSQVKLLPADRNASDISESEGEDPEFPGPRMQDIISSMNQLAITDMDIEDEDIGDDE